MTTAIEFSPEAEGMIRAADDRWVEEHGFDANNPLLDEVDQAVDLLRETPELGVRYQPERYRRHEIRRLLLRCGWHVYYTFDSDRNIIVVVAVWFAGRESGPPL